METLEQMATRFAQCDSVLLEWAEEIGQENLKSRMQVADAIAAQASTTITLFLAGIGGSLAYAARLLEAKPPALAYGAAAVCVYLTLLSVLLLLKCITLTDAPAVFNEPTNLLLVNGELDAVRAGELANMQVRIDRIKTRNSERARWLNAMRWAAILTPLLFLLTTLNYR